MKWIYKTKATTTVLAAVILFSIASCKKALNESNLGGQTAETYYNTAQGFEDLVKSNYSNLRPIFTANQSLFFIGTDIFSSNNITDNSALNLYNSSFNSVEPSVDKLYSELYTAINIANNTLYWATQVTGEEATLLNTRVAEAKALRAYYYYMLAETFGDVPLVTTRAVQPTLTYTRAPESAVYTQIIQDLNEAIAVLPVKTDDPGRVTIGMAKHLLAKVYLTRATKSYGGAAADYQKAADLADQVIAGPYALNPSFSSMFDPTVANFQGSNEIIFAIQYSSTKTTNSAGNAVIGNNLNQLGLWDNEILPTMGRNTFYNKPSDISLSASVPTPYMFTLFDKAKDSRYSATFWNTLVAQIATGGVALGDTVIFYPDNNLTPAQIAGKKYTVINPDQYRTQFLSLQRCYPEPKKFREVGIPYQDYGGFRNTYVFRLAETYLIGAEANLQTGNTTKALQLYNAVRTRAAKPGNDPATGVSYAKEMQVTSLTIDDILDERARELWGEEIRWFELKRTGKLISRTLAHNDEAKASNTLNSHFLLRPIPQSMIDLNQGNFPQNPGY